MHKDPSIPNEAPKETAKAGSTAVSQFLQTVARTPVRHGGKTPGRLIFAMDATASREPTWDSACQIQAEMFAETSSLGGLLVQLCYYRGFQQFHSEAWCANTAQLQQQITFYRDLNEQSLACRLQLQSRLALCLPSSTQAESIRVQIEKLRN